MAEIQIPQCPNCGATLFKVKDKEYYACPNWRPHGAGCEGTIWDPRRKSDKFPEVAFTHKVESKSNPGHYHIVRVYESGDMDCPCFQGRINKFCRHKRITIEDVGKLIEELKEKHLKPNKI